MINLRIIVDPVQPCLIQLVLSMLHSLSPTFIDVISCLYILATESIISGCILYFINVFIICSLFIESNALKNRQMLQSGTFSV